MASFHLPFFLLQYKPSCKSYFQPKSKTYVDGSINSGYIWWTNGVPMEIPMILDVWIITIITNRLRTNLLCLFLGVICWVMFGHEKKGVSWVNNGAVQSHQWRILPSDPSLEWITLGIVSKETLNDGFLHFSLSPVNIKFGGAISVLWELFTKIWYL